MFNKCINNIILDLDGTLIDSYYGDNGNNIIIKARPFLCSFFSCLFYKYKRISIWTNGSSDWFQMCYDKCLKKYMSENMKFDFIITFDDGLVLDKSNSPKKLTKIYQKYSNYNSNNTYIIDDSVHTIQDNLENALLIPTFIFDPDEPDEPDYNLLEILYKLENKQKYGNIYNI
jgi:hypothetical protein